MPLVDPIDLLQRPDKWYLGNGSMLLYAPPFPEHLDVPGFWDECQFGDLILRNLLCISFALQRDGGLVELTPRLTSWQWRPDRIEAEYQLFLDHDVVIRQPAGITLKETRRIGPDGILYSQLALQLNGSGDISETAVVHIVGWTVRETKGDELAEGFAEVERFGRSITYRQELKWRASRRGANPLRLSLLLSGNTPPDSLQITPSHGTRFIPRLSLTPFWDELKHGKLNDAILGENALGNVVFAGLHWRANLKADEPYSLEIRVSARNPATGSRPRPLSAQSSGATVDPASAWREFISLIPHFQCSDEMLTRYYWYRWYGIRLNTIPPDGMFTAPAVTEGLGYFRGVITYSLMCHLFDCKWLHDPSLARGCLRNHLDHQTRLGHLPGHIYVNSVNTKGFYHTDVGHSVGDILAHHPDTAFQQEITPALTRLLMYYLRERDKEGLDLFDVWDQFETGQEFASRYFHAHPRADLFDWEHKLKLKGVDVSVYVYHLVRLLQRLGEQSGDARAVRHHAELAERIKVGVRSFLWDEERGFFFDYNAHRREISPYWSAVGFYPLLSTLATPEQALIVGEQLKPGARFDAPWPTPTVPPEDPHFSADPRWRGERANCPWNGRVWPMVNSHMVEVIARLAELDPPYYRPYLAKYLRRFIELLHFEKPGGAKDLSRPNCFEHYHPEDGTASEYRGVDDYMHSWVADNILRYVAGVRLLVNELTVDPFPFDLDYLLLTNCRLAGHQLDICYNVDRTGEPEPGYRVYLDNEIVRRSEKPTAWQTLL